MSDTILRIIPTNPTFIPTALNQHEANVILIACFPDKQIEFTTTEDVKFIDQGENFEKVSCNLCKREIGTEAWQLAMDSAFEHRFEDLTFISPCCHSRVSLNDLEYEWPAGFAKFLIAVNNPNDEITQNDLHQLEEVLGSSLRIIWAHY